MSSARLYPLTLLLCLPLWAVSCGPKQVPASSPQPAPRPALELDLSGNQDAQADRLYAQLWMEISAEYEALCLQAFNAALLSVRRIVTLAPKVRGVPVGAMGKPLAVVADLDETILDNSAYQRQLVIQRKEYSSPSWNQWVGQPEQVRLVPGAKHFIQSIESLGVTPIYISDRPDELREYTIEALALLGLDTSGLEDPEARRLLLRGDYGDKAARRALAMERFEIIAYIGDNANDFPAEGHEFSQLWGTRWFVLPNPIYGSWISPFRGQDPMDYLKSLPPR